MKKVREWEEEVGVAPRKAEVTGHKWTKPAGPKRKRGRSRKLEEEVDPKYLLIRKKGDRIKELMAEGVPSGEAKAKTTREGRVEAKEEERRTAAQGMVSVGKSDMER